MSGELAAARAGVPTGSRPKVAFLYMRGSAAVHLIGGKGSGADSLLEAAGALDAGTAAAAWTSRSPRSPPRRRPRHSRTSS
jgi:iron complex transport system substrate-binding protein